MKALSILGTSSNSGKSWLATAFCHLLYRKGLKVAPFKAQNMSNNSYATLGGEEIGRAQAVQAEACGLLPSWQMNPVLLKPSGNAQSQVLLRGRVQQHLSAREYFSKIEDYWQAVELTLQEWGGQWDALVLEGAGSPVELNLMGRDIANLRPIRHLDGRWLLCADIERGGVFAQIVGTWNLLPKDMQDRCLGIVVNKFRGDLSLFSDAEKYLKKYVSAPLLGTLPYRNDLQPEPEDSLSLKLDSGDAEGEVMAWIQLPHLSNSTDAEPWGEDKGVRVKWMQRPSELGDARILVIPGSKDTLSDLQWLQDTGWAEAIVNSSILVIGICGGYQMLGRSLQDTEGVAGLAGQVDGLGCIPMDTIFEEQKLVQQVVVSLLGGDVSWTGYEIHMGRSQQDEEVSHFLEVDGQGEGVELGRFRGTYVHGLFDHPAARLAVTTAAGFSAHVAGERTWQESKSLLYAGMADCLEQHLNLDPVFEYLAIDE
ncbi:MAG: cobyric acid synthase [Verrucomicrobiales bacterium]|nr:cobyric acid synthase [Verrucomicrobiales bacterium]